MRIIFAAILFLLSSDSYSDNKFSISNFGDILNNSGDIQAFYEGSPVILNVSGCSIKWHPGDPFYMVRISDDEIYAIKKETYDSFKLKHQNDDHLTASLLDHQSICSITVVK